MPSSTRTGPHTPTSPGRGTPRSRTRRSTTGVATAPNQPSPSKKRPRTLGRGFHLTRRAVALFVLILVLAVSYFNSLRVYFDQQRQIDEARAHVAERTEAISSLETELHRWQDPAFVKAQARSRLGWVMPGEVGYRVIGEDGKPIDTDVQIDRSGSVPPGEEPPTWYESLWGSVATADDPQPR